MTGAQLRQARILLSWSADKLAWRSGLTYAVIGRYERLNKMTRPRSGMPQIDRVALLKAVLEKAGVEFIEEGGIEVAIRLRKAGSFEAGPVIRC